MTIVAISARPNKAPPGDTGGEVLMRATSHPRARGGLSLVVRSSKGPNVAFNERTERAMLRTDGVWSQGPIRRRQDVWRLRAGNPAPRVPFNRQAVYRRLGGLAESTGLIGEGEDQVDGVHPTPSATPSTRRNAAHIPFIATNDAGTAVIARCVRAWQESRLDLRADARDRQRPQPPRPA